MTITYFSKKFGDKVSTSELEGMVHENGIIQNQKPQRAENDIFDQQSRGFFQSSAFRSSRPEVFYKRVVRNNFEKFAGKNVYRSLFLIKLQD